MRYYHLLRFTLLLFAAQLGTGFALCQTPTQLRDQHAYRGNPYSIPVIDLAIDDTASYTATVYYSKLGAALPSAMQPVLTRSMGLLQIKLPATTLFPALAWVEIKRNSTTVLAANVYTDKSAVPIKLGYPEIRFDMPDEPYVSLWQELMEYNY